MKRHLFFFVFVISCNLLLFSQTIQRNSIGMNGNSKEIVFNNTIYYISQSVGQNSPIGTLVNQNLKIRQGFQQPFIIKDINNSEENLLNASIFPNPTDGIINIVINQKLKSKLKIQLFDNYGKLVKIKNVKYKEPISIDMSNLSNGVYIVILSVDNLNRITKIIKK